MATNVPVSSSRQMHVFSSATRRMITDFVSRVQICRLRSGLTDVRRALPQELAGALFERHQPVLEFPPKGLEIAV